MGWLGPFGTYSTPLDSQRPALQFGIWFWGSSWSPGGVKTRKTSQKSSTKQNTNIFHISPFKGVIGVSQAEPAPINPSEAHITIMLIVKCFDFLAWS